MSQIELHRVAGVQMTPQLGQITANLDTILIKLAEAATNGARLIVFPECALSGYGFSSREDGLSAAVSSRGPEFEALAVECAEHGVYTVVGFLESEGDRLYNAAALIGPRGLVGVYRKIHLPYLGVDMFVDPGDRPFEVLDAGGLRIGLHICYDAGFPEPGRILSLLGADLLVLPTNWPTHAECAAEHMVPTRAMENTVYMMAINRVGEESGFRFIGRSSIVDVDGTVLAFASPTGEETLYADIDVARARQKALVRVEGRHHINRIADRRPGFYQQIVAPNGRD